MKKTLIIRFVNLFIHSLILLLDQYLIKLIFSLNRNCFLMKSWMWKVTRSKVSHQSIQMERIIQISYQVEKILKSYQQKIIIKYDIFEIYIKENNFVIETLINNLIILRKTKQNWIWRPRRKERMIYVTLVIIFRDYIELKGIFVELRVLKYWRLLISRKKQIEWEF